MVRQASLGFNNWHGRLPDTKKGGGGVQKLSTAAVACSCSPDSISKHNT